MESFNNAPSSEEKNVNERNENVEKMSDEELEQNNIAHEYRREYDHFKNLNESYQQRLRVLDSLRKESNLGDNTDAISNLEKELSSLSSSIDGSQSYMDELFSKLSPESKNKHLKKESENNL